jgi:hypothetical protein
MRVSVVKSNGIAGYISEDWKKSETLQYLKNNMDGKLKEYSIFSNEPAAVYFHSGLSCSMLPEKIHKEEVVSYYQNTKHYLIMFSKRSFKDELLELDSISRHKYIDTIAILADGGVYQIR